MALVTQGHARDKNCHNGTARFYPDSGKAAIQLRVLC